MSLPMRYHVIVTTQLNYLASIFGERRPQQSFIFKGVAEVYFVIKNASSLANSKRLIDQSLSASSARKRAS